MQRRITEKGRLLNEKGELLEKGYATELIRDYRRADIKAPRLRIKEWDYYYVGNGKYGAALVIADNSYMGLLGATFFDFTKPFEHTKNAMKWLTKGRTGLPPSSSEGSVSAAYKGADIKFVKHTDKRELSCAFTNFYGKKDFFCEFTLFDEPAESTVIATPFKGKPRHFYYNQKINCMRASGCMRLGTEKIEFSADDTTAVLDWGRGVWPYSNTWYWGSASGYTDGVPFGFNIGYGFGDTTNASENMLIYDGKAHKLEAVTFNIPKNAAGKEEFTRPWTFSSSDGRFEMDFVPVIDRYAHTSALVISSLTHQVFGAFSGTAVLGDGQILKIKDLPGFAEKVKNKW